MTVDSERTPLQEECYRLLHSSQFKSCEVLARMDLSTAEKNGHDPRVAWSLLGECAQATQQYARALSYYRRIQYASVPGVSVSSQNQYANTYRLKEAQCLQALGNVVEASSVLERVPKTDRDITMHMLLGNLYIASGRTTHASECFIASLTQNPFCLEAVEWLAALGTDKHTVQNAIATGITRKKMEEGDNFDDVSTGTLIATVRDLVEAHFARYRHQTAASLHLFIKLERDFPNNVYLLLKIAALQVRHGNDLCTKFLNVFVCLIKQLTVFFLSIK